MPLGPTTVRTDQVDYAEAIGDASLRLTLLNLVRVRYGESPTFLQISQIVAGYSLSSNVSLNVDLDTASGWRLGNDGGFGASGTFNNNPTITYSPVTGRDFAALLLTPQNPVDLFGMILGGVAPELVLGLGLDEINGLRNSSTGLLGIRPSEPEFREFIQLASTLYSDGLLRLRISGVGNDRSTEMQIAKDPPAGPADARKRRLRTLLRLRMDVDTYPIVYGSEQANDREIAVRTRSISRIMADIASAIDVPVGDVEEGRTFPTQPVPMGTPIGARILISSAPGDRPFSEPEDALVAVRYRSHWYYIADTDFRSKRAFTFLVTLIRLVQDSESKALPVITIPAG